MRAPSATVTSLARANASTTPAVQAALDSYRLLAQSTLHAAILHQWTSQPSLATIPVVNATALDALARSVRHNANQMGERARESGSGEQPAAPVHHLALVRADIANNASFHALVESCLDYAHSQIGVTVPFETDKWTVDPSWTLALIARLCAGTTAHAHAIRACDIMMQHMEALHADGRHVYTARICTWLDSFSTGVCADEGPELRQVALETLRQQSIITPYEHEMEMERMLQHPLLGSLLQAVRAADWKLFYDSRRIIAGTAEEAAASRSGLSPDPEDAILVESQAREFGVDFKFAAVRNGALVQLLEALFSLQRCRLLQLEDADLSSVRQGIRHRLRLALSITEQRLEEAKQQGKLQGIVDVQSVLPRHMARENEQISSALVMLARMDRGSKGDAQPSTDTFWRTVGQSLSAPEASVVLAGGVKSASSLLHLMTALHHVGCLERQCAQTCAAVCAMVPESSWTVRQAVDMLALAAAGGGKGCPALFHHVFQGVFLNAVSQWKLQYDSVLESSRTPVGPSTMMLQPLLTRKQLWLMEDAMFRTMVHAPKLAFELADQLLREHKYRSAADPEYGLTLSDYVRFGSWLTRAEVGHIELAEDPRRRTPARHDRYFRWLVQMVDLSTVVSIPSLHRGADLQSEVSQGTAAGEAEEVPESIKDCASGMAQVTTLLYAIAVSKRVPLHAAFVKQAIERLSLLPDPVLQALLGCLPSYTLVQWHTINGVLAALQRQEQNKQYLQSISGSRISRTADDAFALHGIPPPPKAWLEAASVAHAAHAMSRRKDRLPLQLFADAATALEACHAKFSAVFNDLQAHLLPEQRRLFDVYYAARQLASMYGLPSPQVEFMTEEGLSIDVAIDAAPVQWTWTTRHTLSVPHRFRGIALLLKEPTDCTPDAIDTLPALARKRMESAQGMPQDAVLDWMDVPFGAHSGITSMDMNDCGQGTPEGHTREFILNSAGWAVVDIRRPTWRTLKLGSYSPWRVSSDHSEVDDAPPRVLGYYMSVQPEGGQHRASKRLQRYIMKQLKHAGVWPVGTSKDHPLVSRGRPYSHYVRAWEAPSELDHPKDEEREAQASYPAAVCPTTS